MNLSTQKIMFFAVFFLYFFTVYDVDAQDGNNYSDRYRQSNNNNYSQDYRENYRENSRYQTSRERFRVFRSTDLRGPNQLDLGQVTSVMRSPKRSINLSSQTRSNRSSGSVARSRSGGGGSGFNPFLISPPTLLQIYMAGQLSILPTTSEQEVQSLNVELEQPDEIKILSPSELLFEEGIQYFRQSRYREAMSHFRSLLDINPDDATKSVVYGLCYLAVRDYETAAQIILDASNKFANKEELYSLIRNIYMKENAFMLHYKQMESKVQDTANDDLKYLESILHAVSIRF